MAIPIGRHTARMDGDILYLKLMGDLSLAEMDAYIELANQVKEQHSRFFIIDDMAHFGSASPEVRKKVASWFSSCGCVGVALHGASLASRTMALLVIGAMKLFGSYTLPIGFFQTEALAHDWVIAQRQKLAQIK
jgi:UDP-N-acetylmuramyl pentapeptide synthase